MSRRATADVFESITDARGRTTVPRQVCECIDAGPGVRLIWHVTPTAAVSVRPRTRSGLDIASLPMPVRSPP